MSRALRYRDPVLCDRLAAQYVAGDMTPRVRRRLEALLADSPELVEAIGTWAEQLAPLQARLPGRAPPAWVWAGIDNQVRAGREVPATPAGPGGWRPAAFAALALCLFLVVLLLRPASGPAGPDYIAPLQWRDQVALVVSAYAGADEGRATLVAQWSGRLEERPAGELHLWAENAERRVYLGQLDADDRNWTLSADAWRALRYSDRLLVADRADRLDPDQAFMVGPCIQLAAYPDAASASNW